MESGRNNPPSPVSGAPPSEPRRGRGPSTLAHRLAAAGRPVAITFAGQGLPVLDELAELHRGRASARRLIEAAAGRAARWVSQREFAWSGLYSQGFDLLSWIKDERRRPPLPYQQSTALSNPLIFLAQAARTLSLYEDGLGELLRSGVVAALTGHSQGLMPALLVAESAHGEISIDRALAYFDYFVWQGLHMQRSYAAAGVGEPDPPGLTGMAALSGLEREPLLAVMAALNARLPENSRLYLTLENSRTRSVVSGRPASIARLKAALERRAAEEAAARKAGRFAGKPLSFTFEPLAVGAPFHAPYMAAGLEAMRATVAELGFRVEASALRFDVIASADGARLNEAEDLTEALMVAQYLRPVRWEATVARLAQIPGLCQVLDLGPGDGVARLTASNLRGTGIGVIPVGTPAGQRTLLSAGAPEPAPALAYAPLAGVAREAKGAIFAENRFSLATGCPPVILPGMTPTTVDVGIVAAAANAGFVAELAGGGQVTAEIFWRRMEELAGALDPGRGVVFNALYLDPYLWDLHVRKAGLVLKAARAGYPLTGLTISAGVPEQDEAVRLLDSLAEAGLTLNAFKPGTLAQIQAVLRIAAAAPDHRIFVQIEGGKAGGHHSWEDLDQLLLDSYPKLRDQDNVVLCVGGGIADEARATALLTGTWSARYGLPPMPVDAVFLGTLAMACREATATPQVKAALAAAAGVPRQVFAGEVAGGVTSGRSQLDADIHYLDNAASRAGRLLDQVAGDAAAVAARRDEIIAALAQTAKPYVGDLEAMSPADSLRRLVALMAIGQGGPYEDGRFLDRSWRTRVADWLWRLEARLGGSGDSALPDLEALDQPEAVIAAFVARYPEAEQGTVHPADALAFRTEICARPGKPVPFVPVIDASVRRWYKSDSLWQAQHPAFSADQVLIIPGPEAVAGIRDADEPVAALLGRFAAAHTAALGAPQAPAAPPPWAPLSGVLAEADGRGLKLSLVEDSTPIKTWLDRLAGAAGGPLAALLRAPKLSCGARRVDNPAVALLRPRAGATLRLERGPDGRATALDYAVGAERVQLRRIEGGLSLTADTGPARYALQLRAVAGGFSLDEQASRDALRDFYAAALFGGALRPVPLFETARATARLEADRAAAYATLSGGAPHDVSLNLAFSLCWEPLFATLAADELAAGLLRLVHLDNAVEAGPAWPLPVGAALDATATVTRVEDGESGRIVQTLATLSHQGRRCATLRSRFFIRGDHSRGPWAVRAREPLEATLDLDDPAAAFLAGHAWLRAEGPLTGRLRLEASLSEDRGREGTPRFTATGRLLRDGVEVAQIALDERRAARLHPLRAALAALSRGSEAQDRPAKRLARVEDRAPASMEAWAEVSFDKNPLHTSMVSAWMAGLDAPIAHGMWTAARLGSLARQVAGPRTPIHAFDVQFLAPLLPGEALVLEASRAGLIHGDRLLSLSASVERPEGTVVVVQATARVAPPLTAIVFPGQGVQRQGMGMEGYARSSAARQIWDRADQHTRAAHGFSILGLVRDNPRELWVAGERLVHPEGALFLTQFTQVGLAVLAQAQVAELRAEGVFPPPDRARRFIAAGHSLGEYNALGAWAGTLTLEAVIDAVYERGRSMHRMVPRDAAGESGYRMGALRPHYAGLDHAGAEALVAEVRAQTGAFVEIVNYNVRGRQYAVTGELVALDALQAALAARTKGDKPAWIEVPGVDVPFHSRRLRPGVGAFRDRLEQIIPADLPYQRLIGRYIPNLVPRPFSLERAFAEAIVAETGDAALRGLLEDWAQASRDPAALARTLLITLLCWQYASPVRWIETQELLFRPVAQGGLGVERLIEVGVGHQPTLAGMARYSLERMGGLPVAVLNAEADAEEVFERSADAPEEPAPAPVAEAAPAPAPVTPAPAPAVVPAPSEAGPLPDRPWTARDALRSLLCLGARIRPDQLPDHETIETLFDGVSSRRNQALMDLGAELGGGGVDGAHELPLSALGDELARRSAGYKAPGKVLRAAQDAAVQRLFSRAGLSRKDVESHLERGFGLGAGLRFAALDLLALETREGESGRGGALGALGSEVPADRDAAMSLVDRAALRLGERLGLPVQRRGASAGPSAAVDAAAVTALEQKLLGPGGALDQAARGLREAAGLKEAAAGLPAPDEAAARLAAMVAEHGEGYEEAVAPRFAAQKHVALCSEAAWARRDVARLFYDVEAGRRTLDAARPEAGRMALFAAEPTVTATARYYASIAKDQALAALLKAIADGEGGAGAPVHPTRPALTIREGGAFDYREEPDPAGAGWWSALLDHPRHRPTLTVAGAAWTALPSLDRPLALRGHTAVITGASPGSIAVQIARHLLRGGARVVICTSSFEPRRLDWYRDLYQAEAGPGAELHLVPFNAGSLADVDALVDWLFSEQREAAGAETKLKKPAFSPDLIVPFAAVRDLGPANEQGAPSAVALRAMLLGVERLISRVAARLLAVGAPRRCHVLLPLSPNHGGFGGDGAYAETKAGLEVLLQKWRSEAASWGAATTLCGARIGWVRGTGLMDANNPVAARLEAETGARTFSSDEMGALLSALCSAPAREAAEAAPLLADLTAGFAEIPDVAAVVGGIRDRLSAEVAWARRASALAAAEASALGEPPPARRDLQPLPAWPAAPDRAPRAADWPRRGGDLSRMVVIVGAGEVGPWGPSRTRFEMEVTGRLSDAGVLELAWLLGLIRFDEGQGWIDVASEEAVPEAALAARYRDEVMSRGGIREIDPSIAGFDPEHLPVMAEVWLDRDVRFKVASEAEAAAFAAADPQGTTVYWDPVAESWQVLRRAGSSVRVPREARIKRRVAGLVPKGFDPGRYGLPREMLDNLDRVALMNLVATVDAFLDAGLSPEELLRWLHPARVANTQGGGLGGQRSLRRMYMDHLMGQERQTDALQETLINVVAAHVVQSYIGSYGPMSHPVGACATAAVSVEEAADKILLGKADFVVAGGYDDLGREGAVGFEDMAATADTDLTTAMGLTPDRVSRPNDRRRKGFVEAHGGGTLLLCRGDVARELGLPVLGVVGYASSFGDGLHKSIPAPGLGALASVLGGSASPLARALAAHGLCADDIDVVYKHDTSTAANDLNENRLHHHIQAALGRSEGRPLWAVSQKALTGHAKGGSAAWQIIGLCQSLTAGVVPGNRNLESVDEAMAPYAHLAFTDRSLRPSHPLRAGLVTSLGFGHVSALVLVLHPDAFAAALSPEEEATWRAAATARLAAGRRRRARVMLGLEPAYVRPAGRRFHAADGSEAQLAEEVALLTQPDARLGADARYGGGA